MPRSSQILPAPPVAPELAETAVDVPGAAARRVHVHGATDPGRKRNRNEDQFLVADLVGPGIQVRQSSLASHPSQAGLAHGTLFAVADGMGGHAGGAYASAAAVTALSRLSLDGADGRIAERLCSMFERIDEGLFARGRQEPLLRGMGTTLVAAVFLGGRLHLAHAGDSRAYLFRNGDLSQITSDHTLLEELVANGVLTAEDAAVHPMRHVITNSLGGGHPGVRVDASVIEVRPGDRILLCSDGLSEMLRNDEIAAVVAGTFDLAMACDELIRRANEAGGRDNITVVLAGFEA
jgi:serine/threonine protein phosphatase PrpC